MARRVHPHKHTHRHKRRPNPVSHQRIYAVMSGEATDWKAQMLRGLSAAGVPPYLAAVAGRNALYAAGVLPAAKLGRPTVSVGNLTAGGTGKTPMVIALARRLQAMGHRPAVLLRGYEPAGYERKKGSDEAAELRGSLGPDVPVMPDGSRVRGAKKVLDEHPATTCFVLDDGFQHRRARRDLNLVLVDAQRPFGFDHLLPRGLLREPPSSLKRADAVILTRTNRVEPDVLTELSRRIEKLTGRPPLAHAEHTWTGLRLSFKDYPLDTLADQTVMGVAGIGNPGDFETKLRETVGRYVGTLVFDDHYRYTRDELSGIFNTALEREAQAVVTTEKDYVKWRAFASGVKARLPVYRPKVEMHLTRGNDELDHLLHDKLGTPGRPT
jgi:tetraacyldisaccharide 4'-kinase